MFQWKHPKKAFHTTFRKRLFGVRPYLLLLMVIFILEIFVQNGKGPTMFLWLRKEFSWDESTFGLYIACFGALGGFVVRQHEGLSAHTHIKACNQLI